MDFVTRELHENLYKERMQRMAPKRAWNIFQSQATAVGFVEPSQRTEELRRTGSPADALLQAGSTLGTWRRFQVLLPSLLTYILEAGLRFAYECCV